MRALPRDGIALASEQEDDEKAASAAGDFDHGGRLDHRQPGHRGDAIRGDRGGAGPDLLRKHVPVHQLAAQPRLLRVPGRLDVLLAAGSGARASRRRGRPQGLGTGGRGFPGGDPPGAPGGRPAWNHPRTPGAAPCHLGCWSAAARLSSGAGGSAADPHVHPSDLLLRGGRDLHRGDELPSPFRPGRWGTGAREPGHHRRARRRGRDLRNRHQPEPCAPWRDAAARTRLDRRRRSPRGHPVVGSSARRGHAAAAGGLARPGGSRGHPPRPALAGTGRAHRPPGSLPAGAGQPAARGGDRLPDRPQLLLPGDRPGRHACGACPLAAARPDASDLRPRRVPGHPGPRSSPGLLHHHPGRGGVSVPGHAAGPGHFLRPDGQLPRSAAWSPSPWLPWLGRWSDRPCS